MRPQATGYKKPTYMRVRVCVYVHGRMHVDACGQACANARACVSVGACVRMRVSVGARLARRPK